MGYMAEFVRRPTCCLLMDRMVNMLFPRCYESSSRWFSGDGFLEINSRMLVYIMTEFYVETELLASDRKTDECTVVCTIEDSDEDDRFEIPMAMTFYLYFFF